MKIINQYIVNINGWQILFECEQGYYITTNDASNHRDMGIIFIEADEAKELIKPTT